MKDSDSFVSTANGSGGGEPKGNADKMMFYKGNVSAVQS